MKDSKDAIRTSLYVVLACFITLGVFQLLALRSAHQARSKIQVVLDETFLEQALRANVASADVQKDLTDQATRRSPSSAIEKLLPALQWAEQKGDTKIFLLGSDYVFPRTANLILKKHVRHDGGTVVGEEYVPLGGTEFDAIIKKIRIAQPQIIFNTLEGGSNVSFFKQMATAGLELPVVSFSITEQEAKSIGPELFEVQPSVTVLNEDPFGSASLRNASALHAWSGALDNDQFEQSLHEIESRAQGSGAKRTPTPNLTESPSFRMERFALLHALKGQYVVAKSLVPTVSSEQILSGAYVAYGQAFSTLPTGTLLYQPPQDMFTHEAQPFTLRITQSTGRQSILSLEEALPGGATAVNRTVRVSGYGMQAHLYGAPDFQIDSQQNDAEIRMFPFGKMLEWSWNVTPQRTGHHILTLDVEALADVNGHDRSLESVNKTIIDVRTNLRETVLSFVSDKFEWLWGLLLIPVWKFAVPRVNKALKRTDTSSDLPQ